MSLNLMSLKSALFTSIAACGLIAAAGSAMADQVIITHHGKTDSHGFSPKYAIIRHLNGNVHTGARAGSFPPTWIFSYTYKGKTYKESFIGTAASGGASTTVPVVIVPMKLVAGKVSEDPTVVKANGVSIIQNILNSPLFNSSVDYVQGGVDVGTTQYEDAFQRANLWGTVKTHPGYHVLLGTPTVTAVQTLKTGTIKSPFGQKIIAANINTFDAKVQSLITSLKIPSNAFPLFIYTNVYLFSGTYASGCCIGGYHSVTSAGQPYGTSSYITTPGNFAEDISAISHELGEWIDDPTTNNSTPCGILEVGDPLETSTATPYGTFPYTVGGVTWHPQDLVLVPYFHAPTTNSVNGYSTFQGQTLAACGQAT